MVSRSSCIVGALKIDRKPGAWFAVIVLSVLYAISFIDRMILSLLAAPIAADLSLNDQQIGVLLGAGFAVTYAIAGVPIATLLDRSNRRNIICFGVAFWSLSTMAAAFADGFWPLAISRGGVALGEAVMAPAAISMIADLFPPDRRTLPTTIFTTVPTVMNSAAFAIGAVALGIAQALVPVWKLAPWRGTLLLVGLPGLIFAIVIATCIREPLRVRDTDVNERETADFTRFIRYLWLNRALYGPFYLGGSMMVMYAYGMLAWLPTLVIRSYGLTTQNTGYVFGLVGVPMSLFGAILFPAIASRMNRRGRQDGVVKAFCGAAVIGTPAFVLAPLAPSLPLLIMGFGIMTFCLTTVSTLSPLAMQLYGPPLMRARLLAVLLLCSGLIGFAIGPSAVAAIASFWPGDRHALGYGLSILGLISGPSAIICFAFCLRSFRQGQRLDGR